MTETQTNEKSPGTKVVLRRQDGNKITIQDVRMYLCPKASDNEIGLFLRVCAEMHLNPFAKDVYLIKYSEDEAASIVVAIDAFLKAAENCPEYDGHEAGIILKDKDGKLEFREGTMLLPTERDSLAGGWAKVFRKDRGRPFYTAVNLVEYIKFTKSGNPTRFWSTMPGTMIRNVALRHSLREAFPNRFTNLYVEGEYETPEDTLPPAYMKDDKNNWRKWWARQAEKGLYEDEIRTILGVESIKEDWIDKGRTLEEADKKINEYLKNRGAVEGTVVSETSHEETHFRGETPTVATAPAKTVKERTEEDIKSFGDLYQCCKDDFGMKSRQEVWDELSGTLKCTVKSQTDIPCTPWECYKSIKDACSK